jgi:hypothetical protein
MDPDADGTIGREIQRLAHVLALVTEQNGMKRFRTSGVEILVKDGVIAGRVYLRNGSGYEDVYEKVGAGQWRITSRTGGEAVHRGAMTA